MKNFLTTLLLLVGVSAWGQGTAVRSNNGIATNLTHVGGQTNGPGATVVHLSSGSTAVGAGTIYSLLDTNGLFRIAIIGTNIFFRDTNTVQLRISPVGVEAQGAGFVGNGADLTNLNLGSFTNQAPVTFNGRVTLVSNVFFNVVSYSTNSAASETTIDLSKSYRAFSTNNNTAFSALAGIESAQTNVQSCNIFITNSSASAKTITMAASFQNMNAIEGNTLSVTNVGHLLVFYYPGFGTNFYFKSR